MAAYRLRHVRVESTGGPAAEDRVFVWGHGWGQSSKAMIALASRLSFLGTHYCVDFPGFGEAQDPDPSWSVPEYMEDLSQFLSAELSGRKVWMAGHSFGARVGVRLADRHGDQVQGLILMGAAGLPRRRSVGEQLALKRKVWTFKALRSMARSEDAREALRKRFGSADYAAASAALRPVFAKVIADDVSQAARGVDCPTLILCGERDTETPPEVSERLSALIPGAQLHILPHFDHWDILTRGAAQSGQIIREFVDA